MSEGFSISWHAPTGAIFGALAKAQLLLRPAIKDSENPHFRSRFASLASCIEACKPLLENGICVCQPPQITGPDGVFVATVLGHSSGEWLRGDLYMPAAKRDPQGFGSALSYARRYCLQSTVFLATDDDDDDDDSGIAKRARTEPDPPRPQTDWRTWAATQHDLLAMCKTAGELKAVFTTAYNEAKYGEAPQPILGSLIKTKDDIKQRAGWQ